jgi:REP element-mobilizing transposase RayT
MPRPRKQLVCVVDTPYYHVFSRCVRRAFLCGVDHDSGKSYEHRRAWIEDRIRVLSSLFSIHLCAYAVMSNHYHLVVKLSPDEAKDWSDDEVLQRWTSLFRGPLLVQRYRAGESLSAEEQDTVRATAAVYRRRLGDLSWFMKCLNEPIARQANAEDGCTGHFWEARFQSQALRSERALLAAMAYVDLNPVRARIAPTPEASEFTSIRVRIRRDSTVREPRGPVARMLKRGELHHFETPIRPLLQFSDTVNWMDDTQSSKDRLPMREPDYLKLVEATGRLAAPGKRGRIDASVTPTLDRLGLSSSEWVQASTGFRELYRNGDLRLKTTG